MSLSPTDLKKIKDAFNEWAKDHPRRTLRTLGGKKYTSKQLAEGLEKNNELGQHLVKFVDAYVSSGAGDLEDAIADLGIKPPKP